MEVWQAPIRETVVGRTVQFGDIRLRLLKRKEAVAVVEGIRLIRLYFPHQTRIFVAHHVGICQRLLGEAERMDFEATILTKQLLPARGTADFLSGNIIASILPRFRETEGSLFRLFDGTHGTEEQRRLFAGVIAIVTIIEIRYPGVIPFVRRT